MAEAKPIDDPMFLAAIDLIRRTGAQDVRIGFYDDEPPTIWHVTATYGADHPVGPAHEVAAAMSPKRAALRLCELLVDGGRCVHCQKPTGFDEDYRPTDPRFDNLICWYRWDPEMRTFRRGCE